MGKQGITAEQRAVLGETLNARAQEIEVVVEDRQPDARYRAARELEDLGLLAWRGCAGAMFQGHTRLRIRYGLTAHGELVARSSLS
jgi:hypothetical protein